MLDKYSIRTDLALEDRERFESDNVEISGVVLEESYDAKREIRMTKVIVETENGAKAMGKPVGTYLTLEAPNMAVLDEDYHREISKKTAECLKDILKEHHLDKEELSVLVVGLGNRQVTPDALGPNVVDNLCVTRHIVKEYGKYAVGLEEAKLVSAIVPGVMGQTGMETLEILKGIVAETSPDLVVAVDALAARNSRRLNRTIQISDTGIHPGSGVGNYRSPMTKETLGIPVIGIGVPTVVDAATLAQDTMDTLLAEMETSGMFPEVGKALKKYSKAQKHVFLRELISPHFHGMFMTPKNEDELIKQMGYTISEALNMLFTNS